MTDLLEDAEALLVDLPDAVERRKLGQRLNQAVTALRNAEHQVGRIVALIELSEIVGFGKTSEQREVLDELIETAQDVGEQLETADSDESLRVAVDEYEHSLPPAISALDRAIRERWRAVVAERFQPLLGLGKLLGSMNVANQLGDRLAACGRAGQAATDVGAITDLLPRVRSLLADYEALQAERAREIGDDDVGEFINALAEHRATLSMVTPNVQSWLDAHQALERLAVSPRV